MTLQVRRYSDAEAAALGVIAFELDPAAALHSEVDGRVTGAVELAGGPGLDPDRTKAVRGLLKFGKYRASGRSKPAQEFLLKAAPLGQFPRVTPAVDLLNATSLLHGLPMSLVDLDRAGTETFALRRGTEGEAYVFNTSGQTIDVKDLLLVARLPQDEPCANPVKDSMATKLTPASRRIAAFVYGPVELSEVVDAATNDLEAVFRRTWPELQAHRGSVE